MSRHTSIFNCIDDRINCTRLIKSLIPLYGYGGQISVTFAFMPSQNQ
ncbi:hypothetical protein LINPERPRIM_LOCUS3097, partial [Linum perenne]